MATFDENKEWRRKLDTMAREVKEVVTVVLKAAGYHQHARGAWRKRRSRPVKAEAEQALAALTTTARKSERAASQYFDQLTSGDPAETASMTSLLIKLHDGDPVRTHETRLLQAIEPGDHLRREAIRRQVMQLRTDLEGPGPVSAVERIIIDRVVLCWLAVSDAEGRVIRAGQSGSILSQKHFDHASKRLNDVVKALSQMRRKTPASHRLSVQVLGDVNLGITASADPSPTVIDLTSIQTNVTAEENEHGTDPGESSTPLAECRTMRLDRAIDPAH